MNRVAGGLHRHNPFPPVGLHVARVVPILLMKDQSETDFFQAPGTSALVTDPGLCPLSSARETERVNETRKNEKEIRLLHVVRMFVTDVFVEHSVAPPALAPPMPQGARRERR